MCIGSILTSFFQEERNRKKEEQAHLLEEQRQKFKEKTSGLLKFTEVQEKEARGARPGRKKKEKSGDIYSDGEGGTENRSARKRQRLEICTQQYMIQYFVQFTVHVVFLCIL